MQHGKIVFAPTNGRTTCKASYIHTILDNPSIPMVTFLEARNEMHLMPNLHIVPKPRSTKITTTKKDTPFAVHYQHQFCWACLSSGFLLYKHKRNLCSFTRPGKLTNQGCCIHTYNIYSFIALLLPAFVPLVGLWSPRWPQTRNDRTTRNPYLFPFFPIYRPWYNTPHTNAHKPTKIGIEITIFIFFYS